MSRTTCLIALIACNLIVIPVGATTFHIEPDGSGDFVTIQDAIAAANSGDTIELANGTFTGPGNRAIDFLGKNVTVESEAQSPVNCIINCENAARAFHLHSGEGRGATIRWVTIRNGRDIPGGAIFCSGASPTIMECRLAGNSSEDGNGGAIACFDSDAAIHNNSISGNVGGWAGGAIFCRTTSGQPRTVVITENFFFGNQVDSYGGAIACDNVYPVIRGNRFEQNTTFDWGGGLSLEDCFGTIEENVFLRNTANYGGAVYCLDSNMQFSKNTMAENHGDEAGGGIYFSNSNSLLDFNTLHGNSTDLWGGGIACTDGSSPNIDHTIIDRSSGGGEAVYCSGGSNPTLTCCDLFANAGGDWVGCIASQAGINGNFSADPLYCDTNTDDFTLHSSSPCAWENNPSCGYVGAWLVGCGETASAEGSFPGKLHLSCTPNPLHGAARIDYTIPREIGPSRVSLRIFDATGRLMRTLVDTSCPVGNHNATWDGRNDSGLSVAAGIYFYQLEVEDRRLTKQIVLVR